MRGVPIFSDFKKAVSRLEESLAKEKTIEIRDSALMRFQMSFDTAIKSLREYLRSQGKECYVAKQCIRAAFQLRLVDHDPNWLEMVDDRNEMIHTYNEKVAEAIYERLPKYLGIFKSLIEKLEEAEI